MNSHKRSPPDGLMWRRNGAVGAGRRLKHSASMQKPPRRRLQNRSFEGQSVKRRLPRAFHSTLSDRQARRSRVNNNLYSPTSRAVARQTHWRCGSTH
jgi:hypothetical protein